MDDCAGVAARKPMAVTPERGGGRGDGGHRGGRLESEGERNGGDASGPDARGVVCAGAGESGEGEDEEVGDGAGGGGGEADKEEQKREKDAAGKTNGEEGEGERRRREALGQWAVLPDELVDGILQRLTSKDVLALACTSSVMNIFCMEEPLWARICLREYKGETLRYDRSWRQTVVNRLRDEMGLPQRDVLPAKPISGFSSMFLYRRWYRCHVVLDDFTSNDSLAPCDTKAPSNADTATAPAATTDHSLAAAGDGVTTAAECASGAVGMVERVERVAGVTPHQFQAEYDGKRPVMLTDLADSWAARQRWTLQWMAEQHGDVALRVSVSPEGRKIKMKLRDYADYIKTQHDEEPLYVFDEKFAEVAPALLEDYSVPPQFGDDLFAVVGSDRERPNYRWLVMGPQRSGAGWHVDPSLTSAWNALLCGRKRWALYPPGRVPPGVVMRIDDSCGDIDYDAPNSLKWWLEVYPFLKPEEKPLEITQRAGETIYVPSGWWHCVLNLDTTVAVTQNAATLANLDSVCLDMAAGHRHRGVARAGQMALEAGEKFDRTEERLQRLREMGVKEDDEEEEDEEEEDDEKGVGAQEGGEEEDGGNGEVEDADDNPAGKLADDNKGSRGGDEGALDAGANGEQCSMDVDAKGSCKAEAAGVAVADTRKKQASGVALSAAVSGEKQQQQPTPAPALGTATAAAANGDAHEQANGHAHGYQKTPAASTHQDRKGLAVALATGCIDDRGDNKHQRSDEGDKPKAMGNGMGKRRGRKSLTEGLEWARNGLQGELSRAAGRFLEEHRGEAMAAASSFAPHELRVFLRRLWEAKPELRDRVWKNACLCFEAHKYLDRAKAICAAHGLPPPDGVDMLPSGTGRNAVFFVGECVVKLYVGWDEDDAEDVEELRMELSFFRQLHASGSALAGSVPRLCGSGVLFSCIGAASKLPLADVCVATNGGHPPAGAEGTATGMEGTRSSHPGSMADGDSPVEDEELDGEEEEEEERLIAVTWDGQGALPFVPPPFATAVAAASDPSGAGVAEDGNPGTLRTKGKETKRAKKSKKGKRKGGARRRTRGGGGGGSSSEGAGARGQEASQELQDGAAQGQAGGQKDTVKSKGEKQAGKRGRGSTVGALRLRNGRKRARSGVVMSNGQPSARRRDDSADNDHGGGDGDANGDCDGDASEDSGIAGASTKDQARADADDDEEDGDPVVVQWPYIITSCCKDALTLDDVVNVAPRCDLERVADFLGDTLRHLHQLPLPPLPLQQEQEQQQQEQQQQSEGTVLPDGAAVSASSAPNAVDKAATAACGSRRSSSSASPAVAENGVAEPMCNRKQRQPKEEEKESKIGPDEAGVAGSDKEKDKDLNEEKDEDKNGGVPLEWRRFVRMLRRRTEDASERHDAMGALPKKLLNQLPGFLPKDPLSLLPWPSALQAESISSPPSDPSANQALQPQTTSRPDAPAASAGGAGVQEAAAATVREWPRAHWLHTDVMSDNLLLQPEDAAAERIKQLRLQPKTHSTLHSTDNSSTSAEVAKAPHGHPSEQQEQQEQQQPQEQQERQQEQQQKQQEHLVKPAWLIDFGELLFGDPLFDVVMLHVSTFRCDTKLLQRFLARYRLPLGPPSASAPTHTPPQQQAQQQHFEQRQPTVRDSAAAMEDEAPPTPPPLPPPVQEPAAEAAAATERCPGAEGLSAVQALHSDSSADAEPAAAADTANTPPPPSCSYRAMCYALLHSNDAMSRVFRYRPHLLEADTLDAVQREVWGCLDDVNR